MGWHVIAYQIGWTLERQKQQQQSFKDFANPGDKVIANFTSKSILFLGKNDLKSENFCGKLAGAEPVAETTSLPASPAVIVKGIFEITLLLN